MSLFPNALHGQATAWRAVFDLVLSMGMKLDASKTAKQDVLDFIRGMIPREVADRTAAEALNQARKEYDALAADADHARKYREAVQDKIGTRFITNGDPRHELDILLEDAFKTGQQDAKNDLLRDVGVPKLLPKVELTWIPQEANAAGGEWQAQGNGITAWGQSSHAALDAWTRSWNRSDAHLRERVYELEAELAAAHINASHGRGFAVRTGTNESARRVSNVTLHYHGIPVRVSGMVATHDGNWPLIDKAAQGEF